MDLLKWVSFLLWKISSLHVSVAEVTYSIHKPTVRTTGETLSMYRDLKATTPITTPTTTDAAWLANICLSGQEQSPIDIEEEECVTKNFDPINFLDDILFTNEVVFTNNNETVKISLVDKSLKPKVMGGPLDEDVEYIVDNVHFHWASREVYGCEHTIEKQRFPMEAHLVLYRSTETDIASALKNRRVAVMSYIFEMLEINYVNPDLHYAIQSVAKVKHPQSVTAHGSVLSFLKYYLDGNGFYSYDGSLTTWPCTEGVLWIVLKKRISIGASQLAVFHDVVGDDEVELHNWRDVCPLNDRIVWKSFF